MKTRLKFAAILFSIAAVFTLPAAAQIPSGYVQTTATVASLANGTFGAAWTNLSTSPQLALLGCVSTFQQTVTGALDSNGHFSTLLADTAQICPSPSTWTFTFTFACPAAPPNGGFQVQVAVTGGGGSEDITSQVTAALPSNPCGGGGGGGGISYVTPTVNAVPKVLSTTPKAVLTNSSISDDGTTTKVSDAFSASVNNVCNVVTHGAKGDGVTDDHDAIQACMDLQKTTTLNVVVSFPLPPGGSCYLTSTLTWTGASLTGPDGSGQGGPYTPVASACIEGMPLEDILHGVDNNLQTFAPPASWSIRHLQFYVNGASDASTTFPTRYLGRWTGVGAMTASSPILTTNQIVNPDDETQNVLVCGAASSGTAYAQCTGKRGTGGGSYDLSTTISTVTPAWRNGAATVITLAANATASPTGAYVYITPLHIPVTTTVGNCALAFDNNDGDNANWPEGGVYNNSDIIDDVAVWSNNDPGTHGTCAFWWQGTWQPYLLDARNIKAYGTEYGNIEPGPSVNLTTGGGFNASSVWGADFQNWENGFFLNQYPWITYNSAGGNIRNFQFEAPHMPQILAAANAYGEVAAWNVTNVESENVTSTPSDGWRFEGGDLVNEADICAGGVAYIGTTLGSYYINCANGNPGNGIVINGFGNHLSGLGAAPLPVTDNGVGNTISGQYNGNPFNGSEAALPSVLSWFQRDTSRPWGTATDDYLNHGLSTYYPSDNDLSVWPEDIPGIQPITDTTADTGRYFVAGFGDYLYFEQGNQYGVTYGGPELRLTTSVGKPNFPANKVRILIGAKCPVATTYTVQALANSTTATSANTTLSCNSSTWTQGEVDADYTGQTGYADFYFTSAAIVWVEYIQIVPWDNAIDQSLTVAPGGTPMTGNQGNGALVQHSTGSPTVGNCAIYDSNGNVTPQACPGTTYSGTAPIVVSGTAISCPSCSVGSGTSLSVNGGSGLGTANLNSSTPAAGAGFVNATIQISSSDISAEVPTAVSQLGFTPAANGANSDITSLTGLTTPLTRAQGGTGTGSSLTGIVRSSGTSPFTAAELSGDVATSGSNVVTVSKLNGTSLAGLATGPLCNTTVTGVPTICTNTQLSTALAGKRPWSCQPGIGDGLNAVPAGTYVQNHCRNTTGVTVTITGVSCYVNTGSSTLNASGATLGALLTGAVTCTSSYASGTQSANVLLTNNDSINFTFISDGALDNTNWVVQGTY